MSPERSLSLRWYISSSLSRPARIRCAQAIVSDFAIGGWPLCVGLRAPGDPVGVIRSPRLTAEAQATSVREEAAAGYSASLEDANFLQHKSAKTRTGRSASLTASTPCELLGTAQAPRARRYRRMRRAGRATTHPCRRTCFSNVCCKCTVAMIAVAAAVMAARARAGRLPVIHPARPHAHADPCAHSTTYFCDARRVSSDRQEV